MVCFKVIGKGEVIRWTVALSGLFNFFGKKLNYMRSFFCRVRAFRVCLSSMIKNYLQLGRAGVFGVAGIGAVVAATSILVSTHLAAQEAVERELTEEEASKRYMDAIEQLDWKRSGEGDIGQWAKIEIPDSYRFSGAEGARNLLLLWGNPPGSQSIGVLSNDGADWGIFFNFENEGYVKDDDKDDLDPVKMLKAMKEGEDEENNQRRAEGYPGLTIAGWAQEPFYNEQTNNLQWGIKLQVEGGGTSVNYKTKLLGREGVMNATLICDESAVDSLIPTYNSILEGFSYNDGKSYADYKEGDKIAKYGLTALVVGGGAAVAAKLGLFAVLGKFFAKAGKLVIVGVIAVGVGIKKFFSRGSGRVEE